MPSSKISPTEAKQELAKRELARRRLGRFIRYITPGYQENWHHRVLIEKLEAVERGEILKLMVFMPPQNGKSTAVSEHFPAWFFGRNPSKAIIASSYNADLAVSFGRKARNIVDSQEYQVLFPKVHLAEDSKAAGQWNTNQKGEYTAVGIGGGTTGRRADIFLIDDPVKDKEEAESPVIQERNYGWYRAVAHTRLSPTGAIIVVQTRWHDQDLSGQILANENDWTIVDLQAIADHDEEHRKAGEPLWPQRYSLEWLLKKKKDIGIELWSSLYQQQPISAESQVFKRSMFRYKPASAIEDIETRCFVTIDPAPGKHEKSDYIGVCVNWVDRDNFWYIKAYRIKFDAAQLIRLFFKLFEETQFEKLGIEKGMYNDVVKPFLDEEMRRRNVFFTVVELDHGQRSKENRIKGLAPRYEARQIFHLEGYCEDLEAELLRFPKAANDDVSDAVAYQLQIAEKPEGTTSTQIHENRRDRETSARNDHGL